MKYFNTIIMSAVSAATLTFAAAPAAAQDQPGYFLIEQNETHPTKSEDYMKAWKTIVGHAKDQDYKFTTFVSRSGPRVSIATPLSSYADIDAMGAERDRVYEASGKSFEKAIESLNAATYSEKTFMVKHMPEISNPPSDADMETITMYEVSTIQIKPGKSSEFKEVLGKYKKGLEKADLLGVAKYNVYSGGVGTNGAYYFQSFANSAVDMAERNAKTDAMFADDEAMQDLFGEFLAINSSGGFSASDKWKMAKDLTYIPAK